MAIPVNVGWGHWRDGHSQEFFFDLLAFHMPGIEYTPIPIKKVPKVQKRESPESLVFSPISQIRWLLEIISQYSGSEACSCYGIRLTNRVDPLITLHFLLLLHITMSQLLARSGKVGTIVSGSVVLYSGNTRQRIKAFSRFLDIAYSGTFRQDGKLLVAGDEKGNIKLFDVESKTMLRESHPHSAFVV